MKLLSSVLAISALGCLAVCADAESREAQSPQRSFRFEDFYARYTVHSQSATYSSDGQAVALVISRPKLSEPPANVNSLVIPEAHADVWVQAAPGEPLTNITQGERDSSGWWEPRWSPNGEQLAMLSTRGGEIHLWVWNRKRQSMRQISTETVRPEQVWNVRSFAWLSDSELMYLTPPEGTRVGTGTGLQDVVEYAKSGWERALRGEVTSNVVESGRYIYQDLRLVRRNIAEASGKVVARTMVNRGAYGQPSGIWWPSPDGRFVAVVSPGPVEYNYAVSMRVGAPRNIEIFDAAGQRLSIELPKNVLTTTVTWTADGRELVFFANGAAPLNSILLHGLAGAEVFENKDLPLSNPARLYRVDVARKRVREVSTGEIDLGQLGAPELFAGAGGDVFAKAPRRQYGYTALPPVSRGAAWGFTSSNAEVPWPAPSFEWFVLDRDGKARSVNVTSDTFPAHTIPSKDKSQRARAESVLQAPAPKASLLTYDAQLESGIYMLDDRSGTYLWRAYAKGAPAQQLLSTNTFRQEIAKPNCNDIEYLSLNNDALKALLCLPAGYVQGRRYPLAVSIYPGSRERHFDADALEGQGPFEREAYLAMGFAYLMPSMLEYNNLPGLRNEEGWSMLMFPHATLPAIDKVVQMGIADNDRVFLYGVSGGGWGTTAMLSQTTRFAAAFAEASGAGWDVYGAGGPLYRSIVNRYSDGFHDYHGVTNTWRFSPSDLPWWRNGDRYRRNDPMTYIDRVQTPLLLVHGDLDGVRIETSEGYFAALAAMGKPTQLVRYWGEGHGLKALANQRDKFMRVFAWFDRWGDITRDERGRMAFEGDRVKSRAGAAPLAPEDYAKFDFFQPQSASGASTLSSRSAHVE